MESLSQLWDSMEITESFRFREPVDEIKAARSRYERVSGITLVPWQVIGVIHSREADCDFHCHLHNGDPLTGRTIHVPKGRPLEGDAPFTWEDSAIDALAYDTLSGLGGWDDIATTLDRIERFNGLGYRRLGLPSPYLWAGTNHYLSGKYTADGIYNPRAIDQEAGAAGLLRLLGYLKVS